MWDYLKYYLAPLTQALSMLGLYMGGDYVWVGLGFFPLMAAIDSMLPLDLKARKMKSRGWAFVPIWLSTLLGPATYLMLAWSVAHHDLTGWQMFGGVMSCAWLSVVPMVPASHELYHARGRIGRTFGRYAQICFLDPTRMEAHVVSHHRDVGTAHDSDTAARGETLYSFAPKAVLESTLLAQRIESDALEKRGFARWSIRHHLWRAILAQVLFQSLIYWIGGWASVGLALVAMVIARFWVETFNYFQHYGQVRVAGSPIEKRHVWNHFGPLSRLVAFEITNHADHHLNTYLSYYELVPHREAIRMPSVFGCFMAALLPPVWFSLIIKPALRRWDNEWASAEERRLAAEQNRRAGWEDWLAQPPATASSSS
ncbi:alkane 1-monooxygenase [Paraburkholderia elongata]|uniref:Alkane 1-monooxygenase n=1 Tax=Paraburkholderia elongata TaxID=2675747 RepID=A0A972NP29_9BURK|nr:alkane 1-monooxygenase [Paraburkholderia elongata]NPT57063.1 alkane 1-monooxygenase [Paraburkholderia elongata]